MYWILNFAPLLIEIVLDTIWLYGGFSNPNMVRETAMAVWVLLLLPIYLLCVNNYYLNRHAIAYTTSIICMILTILIRIVITLIYHGVIYGDPIGDVPAGIYQILTIIPIVIIIVSMAIRYLICRYKG